MIRLQADISQIDFDSLVRLLMPKLTPNLPLGRILAGLNTAQKEKLAVELFNSNNRKIIAALEDLAQKQGLRLSIQDLSSGIV